MKNLYQSLENLILPASGKSTLDSYKSREFMREGTVVFFDDADLDKKAFLRNNTELTLVHTTGNLQASYIFLDNTRLISQKIILIDNQKEVEIQTSYDDKTWSNAFLTIGNDAIANYAVMLPDNNPEKNIAYSHHNSTLASLDLPFDGKFYRWTEGLYSYEASDDVVEVMAQSRGYLSEDQTVASVCDLFDMTTDELTALPSLLKRKYNDLQMSQLTKSYQRNSRLHS